MLPPIMSQPDAILDICNPINWWHPLNKNLTADYTVVTSGGSRLRNLVDGTRGVVANFDVNPWRGSMGRPGGIGTLSYNNFGYVGCGVPAPNYSGNITLAAWVNIKTLSVSNAVFCSYDGMAQSGQFILYITTGGKVTFLTAGGGVFKGASGNYTLAVNTWYHIAITKTILGGNYTVRLYVNGALDTVSASTSNNTPATQYDTNIGAEGIINAHATIPFNGYIDGVMAYNNRVLTDAEINDLYWETATGNPNRWSWYQGPATNLPKVVSPILLAGNAAMSLTPSATLTTSIRLAGSTTLTAVTTASLTTAISLAGSTTVTAATTGNLTTAINLAGSASVTFAPVASLTTAITLAGNSTITTATAGDLTTAIYLAGNSSLSHTAAGDLTTAIQLAGSTSIAAATTAALTTEISLVGATTLSVATTGALTTEINLAGQSNLSLTASGDLATAIQLAGATSIITATSGDLATAIQFAGACALTLNGDGDLTTAINMAGDAGLDVTAAAVLATEILLAGAADLTMAADADLTTDICLMGDAWLTLDGEGDLATEINLAGSTTAAITTAGALLTGILLEGSTGLAATTTSSLATGILLAGNASLSFSGDGDLAVFNVLRGAATLSFTATAALATAITLAGDAAVTFDTTAELTTASFLAGDATLAFNTSGDLSVPIEEHTHALQLNDTSRRNVMIWDDCGTGSSVGKQCAAHVQLTNEGSQQNAGLVLNYRLDNPLTNPQIKYFVAQINRNANRIELLSFNGAILVTENSVAPGLPFSLTDWYDIRVIVTTVTGGVQIRVQVRNVSTPSWPTVTLTLVTNRWGATDGRYGIHTTRAVSNFSCWRLSDV